jgi:acetoin utilization protein AcuB
MTAKDLINYTIPPLKLSDSVKKAQKWMEKFHVNEFPVVDKGEYYGIFSEDLIFDQKNKGDLINEYDLKGRGVYVTANEHYYEILNKSYTENLDLIAVLDEHQFLGVICIQDVVEAFSKMSSISSPGAIIVIMIPQIDYSMAEISRIIESEYGKILSSFVENHPDDPSKLLVTVKLNVESAKNIISALERFGFTISSIYKRETDNEVEQVRLDTLFKYLQI